MYRRNCIVLSILFLACMQVSAQSDYGMGTSPFESSPAQKKERMPRPPDIYVQKIAQYFNVKEEEVARLWNRGYGRNELIKLLLIMQKSRQKLRDLARMRDKHEKLSKIAAKYDLDYDALLGEAIAVRETIDRRVSDGVPKADLSVSSGNATVSNGTVENTTAGTSTSTEKNHE